MKTFETVFFFNGKMKAEIKMICNCQLNVHTKEIYVVIKPEFSKFPKKIKVWSLSSSRCKFFRKCRLRILEEK